MDSLLSRLASVGLIVLAANPDACGIVEILREAKDPGAPTFLLVLGDLGDFGGMPTEARHPSGARDVLMDGWFGRGGGCSDLDFPPRAETGTFTPPPSTVESEYPPILWYFGGAGGPVELGKVQLGFRR